MDKEKFKLQQKEKQGFSKILKLYLMPIVVGLGFVFIIIFLIIPTIFGIFSTLDEISLKNQNYDQNVSLLNQLKTLDTSSSQIRNNLNSVNNITTADQTEVVKFRNRITSVIVSNNLTIFSQQLTETDPTIISNGANAQITLKEVPFSFKIEGSYNDIVNFFNDLSVINDFVIIKEMTFSRSEKIATDSSTIWLLDLVLVKYQFNAGEGLEEIYKSILPGMQVSQKVLTYINQRTENN